MGQTLYFECNSGISGDMTVAALLDLGADEGVLRKALDSMPLDGFEIEISRVKKAGLDVCDFNVRLDGEHENHDHDMEYLHGHDHHGNGLQHGQEHHPIHAHEHRGLPEITRIIEQTHMSVRAEKTALRIFDILARAEAKAHGIRMDEVHFHEVGAVDSIVDIVATAVCLDNLGITDVIIPCLCEGRGTVRCQHGLLPIPVPAVANIVQMNHIPLRLTDVWGELVTPTGAAIAAALRSEEKLPEQFTIKRIGMGGGKRQYERPSILRAMLIQDEPREKKGDEVNGEKTTDCEINNKIMKDAETKNAKKNNSEIQNDKIEGSEPIDGTIKDAKKLKDCGTTDRIYKIESNIDDCTGEMLGHAMERLFENGALEVNYAPVFMKKNRPAYLLTVLCSEENVNRLENVIFRETTTIGVRKIMMERTVLDRKTETIALSVGEMRVKKCILPDGTVRTYPEYESAAELAGKTGKSMAEILNLFSGYAAAHSPTSMLI